MSNITRTILLSLVFLTSLTVFQAKGNYLKKDDGILVNTDSVNIRLHVPGENIIRVECRLIQEAQKHQSLVVVNSPQEKVRWSLREEPGAVVLTTASLQAKVDLSSGKVQFLDTSGNILLKENGREINQVTVIGEKTNSIRQKFMLSRNEAIYGLGQHQEGNMNL
ncbi:DUF4968 domain-containing protein, partial [candidate division WOR-3 bacterium]|nr:DUF4968 domain-containing protein [candidate division WOR-3 bacterium]